MKVDSLEKITFKAGEVIFEEGDDVDGLYLISEGEIKITRSFENKEISLTTLGLYDVFGEMAIIDHSPRCARATAITDGSCMVISSEIFEDKLEETDPFVKGTLKTLVKIIRNMNDKSLLS